MTTILDKKSTRRRFMSLTGAALALVPVVAHAGEQDFKLINRTGFTIASVYVSPHNAKDWGDDILGDDDLPNGKSVTITFKRTVKAAIWDLSVEDEDGEEYTWDSGDFNLKEISEITLFYTKKGGARAEWK